MANNIVTPMPDAPRPARPLMKVKRDILGFVAFVALTTALSTTPSDTAALVLRILNGALAMFFVGVMTGLWDAPRSPRCR